MIKIALIAGILFMILPAHAADDKASATKAQLRQVQQEKHKLEQDKAHLEQDKAELDSKLKAAQESLDSVKKNAENSSHRSSGLQKELELASSEKADLAAKLADVQKQLAESDQKLKATLAAKQAVETAKAQLEANLGQQNQTLASCEAKNQEEYKYGVELLEKYEKKSCFTSMLQREPFFGIAKTKLENEVADLKEKLDKQHLPQPKEVAAEQESVAP
jgi:chromosome segregation ATPase